MDKLDLKKKYRTLYQPSAKQVELVDVPPLRFLILDGAIEAGEKPGTSPKFQEALDALYGIAYTLKFMSKLAEENPIDFTVMTLEGLWWVKVGEFDISKPGNWMYTLMIVQPDHITLPMFQEGLRQLRQKKGDHPVYSKLRLEGFHEGLSIQVLHIGPYSEEMKTIARMDEYARNTGLIMHGKHHEIYMGDPRRGDPSKLKTVLRHPVQKK